MAHNQQLLNKIITFFKKKTLLVIGIYSSRKNTGISNNFDILINGLVERGVSFDVVKINARSQGAVGSFRLSHFFNVFASVAACWIKSIFCQNVCTQIAFSKLGFFRDLLVIWPASMLGKKVFVRVHTGAYGIFYDNQSNLMKFLIRAMLERTYRIIILGESLRGQFDFSSKLKDKLVVIPNGLDIDSTPINSHLKKWGEGGVFNILYLSNMIISKGYLHLLEACRILEQENIRDFRADFCGEFINLTDEENQLSPQARKFDFLNRIKSWKLEDHVHYHGSVIGSRKENFLRNAHVLILPTNYLWEGQPLSIIEALAFGTPVISTNFRAIPDEVVDGINGFLVDFGSPEQIKEAIIKLMSDPVLYKKLNQNARKIYLEKFTKEKHLDKLIPLITQ